MSIFGIRSNIKRIKNLRRKSKEKYHNFKETHYSRILYHLPKTYAHKKLHMKLNHIELNLDNPTTFNEKITYLIIHKHGKKEGYLSDKIKVKDYVKKKKIKNLYIPKTLKIYKKIDDINLDELPNEFVLKCNHSSGGVIICKDKKTFDLESSKKSLRKILKENYAKRLLEYHYKYIKPKVYAEEYISDNDKTINPIDYKIYCINGKAKSILVCSERETGLKLSEYDLNWKRIDCITDAYNSKVDIPKPKYLKELISIAEKLSSELSFVRVDLYETKDKIYFGELTFTPAGGVCIYYNDYGMKLHGDYIDIDNYYS